MWTLDSYDHAENAHDSGFYVDHDYYYVDVDHVNDFDDDHALAI